MCSGAFLVRTLTLTTWFVGGDTMTLAAATSYGIRNAICCRIGAELGLTDNAVAVIAAAPTSVWALSLRLVTPSLSTLQLVIDRFPQLHNLYMSERVNIKGEGSAVAFLLERISSSSSSLSSTFASSSSSSSSDRHHQPERPPLSELLHLTLFQSAISNKEMALLANTRIRTFSTTTGSLFDDEDGVMLVPPTLTELRVTMLRGAVAATTRPLLWKSVDWFSNLRNVHRCCLEYCPLNCDINDGVLDKIKTLRLQELVLTHCDLHNRVAAVDFFSPALEDVRVLKLDHNDLAGPVELLHLQCLEVCDLSSNSFSSLNVAALPPNLVEFFCDTNQLADSRCDFTLLPVGLTTLKLHRNMFCANNVDLTLLPASLELLGLNENNFSGQVDLTKLPRKMKFLYLYVNKFSGPVDLSKLSDTCPDLEVLSLANNEFSCDDNGDDDDGSRKGGGTLDLTNLPKNLRRLDLSNCKFRCELPDLSRLPLRMAKLHLQHSEFTGNRLGEFLETFPATLTGFRCDHNQLSGKIFYADLVDRFSDAWPSFSGNPALEIVVDGNSNS